MRVSFALAFVTIAALAMPAHAQDRTLPSGFSNYAISEFEMQQMAIAVATDKQSGRKVNVIKMKNGHMMALVPFESYATFMKPTGPDDMWQ